MKAPAVSGGSRASVTTSGKAARRMVGVAEPASTAGAAIARRIRLRGHVQGVGFRPFVYRLALEHDIAGHVQNQLGEVEVLAMGSAESVSAFLHDLVDSAPP